MRREWKTPTMTIILLIIGSIIGTTGLFLGRFVHPTLFYLLTPIGIVLMGVGMYVTVELMNRIFRSEQTEMNDESIEFPAFIENAKYHVPEKYNQMPENHIKETVIRSFHKTIMLEELVQKFNDSSMRNKIRQIINTTHQILEEIKNYPNVYLKSRPFLNILLDSTIELVQKYHELSIKKSRTPEMDQSLKKTEALMNTLNSAFNKQLQVLYSDEALELEVEVDVLRKALKTYGR